MSGGQLQDAWRKADKQVKTIRDELTKQFEQLAVKSGIGSGKGDKKDTADG
jgi:hypothetical protein